MGLTDLIDRNILMAKMLLQHEDYHSQGATDMAFGYGSAICDVIQAPAVDAEPVKRGRWVRQELAPPSCLFCSECGFPKERGRRNFCSNCGAKNVEVEKCAD